MNVTEKALNFPCGTQQLLGVLSRPDAPRDVGVLVIVGGPQYRVGSHRQFVHLARRVASAGFACLRFDYRGMGDSEGELRDFEQVDEDISAAITALLQAEPGLRGVVLWGLCDGASAALLYLSARPDPRVCGLALLNPWVRTEASQAQTRVRHYYLQRLAEPAFWRKLLSGGVALRALSGLAGNLRAAFGGAAAAPTAPGADYTVSMARAWQAYAGPSLLMLSEHDYTAREFELFTAGHADWQRAFATHPPRRVNLAGADHTCASPQARADAERATIEWLGTLGEGRR